MKYDALFIRGHLRITTVKPDGRRFICYDHHNTIGTLLHTNSRTVLISRSVEYGVDAIAWGSFSAPGGTFIDSDFAGTTSFGTKGSLIQSAVGSNQAKFSGTFSFSTDKFANFFQLGRGHSTAAAGISALFSTIYAFDNSLLTGSTYVQWGNGDAQIVDWIIQYGS